MIEVPQHGSLPSGHATEGHVIAGILTALVPGASGTWAGVQLRRVAHRIADNRVIAGLHFPVDNLAGRLLGDALGQYVLALCGQPHVAGPVSFVGRVRTVAEAAVDRASQDDPLCSGPGCSGQAPKPASIDSLPILAEMWAAASREWECN